MEVGSCHRHDRCCLCGRALCEQFFTYQREDSVLFDGSNDHEE